MPRQASPSGPSQRQLRVGEQVRHALAEVLQRGEVRDEVLEAYVRGLIDAHHTDEVTFAWQGGEPTLMGIDFFRRGLELQRQAVEGAHVGVGAYVDGGEAAGAGGAADAVEGGG